MLIQDIQGFFSHNLKQEAERWQKLELKKHRSRETGQNGYYPLEPPNYSKT